MKKFYLALAALSIFLTISGAGYGQASVAANQLTVDEPGGYSFTAPIGWKGGRGEVVLPMRIPAATILISVRKHGYNDFAAAVRDTKLDSDSRIVGEPQDLKNGGKALRIANNTPQGMGVIDLFVLFSPNGGGTIVMALSLLADSEAAFNAGLKISDSVTFKKAARTEAASGWQAALSGKHLLYLYSGNGYFEEKHFYLCPSGNFVQTTGSGGYTPGDADGGSFAGRGGRRGKWSVNGATLILRFEDGAVGEYNITQRTARNEVGLNGKRYFVQDNAGCK